jgi:hypothetical protein
MRNNNVADAQTCEEEEAKALLTLGHKKRSMLLDLEEINGYLCGT